jgi:hypothetical protein
VRDAHGDLAAVRDQDPLEQRAHPDKCTGPASHAMIARGVVVPYDLA